MEFTSWCNSYILLCCKSINKYDCVTVKSVTTTYNPIIQRQLQPTLATDHEKNLSSESQQFSERISNGLCQFLAYYNLLRTMDTNVTESLQVLLRRNLMDGCQMMKVINNTIGGVNITVQPSGDTVTVEMTVPFVEGGPTSCNPDENSLLHHYCTRKNQRLNILFATSNIVNTYAVHGIEDHCDWVNSSLPDPHRSVVADSLNCSNNSSY